MPRTEIKEKGPDYKVWVLGAIILGLFVWNRLPSAASGGNGLPYYANGGDWEETRTMTFFPEGTKYTASGQAVIPGSYEYGEMKVLETVSRTIRIVAFHIVCGLWAIVAVICYRIYHLN